jgi:hypothetical protein
MTYANQQMDSGVASNMPTEMPGAMEAMTFRVPRPGARPLSFTGTELAMAMSFTPELPFWYEINIYRTTEQRFVLAVRLFHQSTEEPDSAQGWVFDTLEEAYDAVEAYDPACDVRIELPKVNASASAELAAWAMETRVRVASQKAIYNSLVGELFDELQRVGAYTA